MYSQFAIFSSNHSQTLCINNYIGDLNMAWLRIPGVRRESFENQDASSPITKVEIIYNNSSSVRIAVHYRLGMQPDSIDEIVRISQLIEESQMSRLQVVPCCFWDRISPSILASVGNLLQIPELCDVNQVVNTSSIGADRVTGLHRLSSLSQITTNPQQIPLRRLPSATRDDSFPARNMRPLSTRTTNLVESALSVVRVGNANSDAESSMEILAAWQQSILTKVKTQYATVLLDKTNTEISDGLNAIEYAKQHEKALTKKVIVQLQEELRRLYIKDPVEYIDHLGIKHKMPLEWDQLQQDLAKFNIVERDAILKLYYQNVTHTAYRYLSKPNPWMAIDAHFVNRDDNNPSYAWANFEQYIPYMAYLWLAASDPAEATTDKLSQEQRQAAFITQLANIAREHNKIDAESVIVSNGVSNVVGIERDDLRGDKPSCHMGVLSRLFASVVDHSMFDVSPDTIVYIAMSNFLKEFYTVVLNISTINLQDLYEIRDAFVEQKYPKLPDVPRAAIHEFLHKVQNNLARVDPILRDAVLQRISALLPLDKPAHTENSTSDFYKFYTAYDLQSLLKNIISSKEVVLQNVSKIATPRN